MDYRRYANPYGGGGRRRRYPRERAEPEYIYQKWWVVELRDARGQLIERLGSFHPFRTEQDAREELARWMENATSRRQAEVAEADVHEITIKLDPTRMP